MRTCVRFINYIHQRQRYADNVLKGDPKFLRIKLGNKAFQARVASVLGGQNFLEALGFRLSEEEGETYLRLPAEAAPTFKAVSKAAFAVLAESSAVLPTLDRDVTVLIPQPGQALPAFDLPPDFYDHSKQELAALVAQKKEDAVKELTLRTQGMRDAEKGGKRKYKYTMLRFRLPDGVTVQGIFYPRECISHVAEFLSEALANPGASFVLSGPGRQELADYSKTLLDCSLVPAALLNITFREGGDVSGLNPELLATVGLA